MQNFKSGNCRLLLLWDGWIGGGGKSVEGIVRNYSRYLKLTYLTNIDNKHFLKFTAPHYESRRISGRFSENGSIFTSCLYTTLKVAKNHSRKKATTTWAAEQPRR